jgi:hypothetical protein
MLIGYTRVSKADGSQVTDLQRDALAAAGVRPEHLYEDLASGRRDDRPGLAACLKALREGDALVVWKLDRLGPSLSSRERPPRRRYPGGGLDPNGTERASRAPPRPHSRRRDPAAFALLARETPREGSSRPSPDRWSLAPEHRRALLLEGADALLVVAAVVDHPAQALRPLEALRRSSAGTTWLTMPCRSARAASTGCAVKSISLTILRFAALRKVSIPPTL